MPTIEKKRMHLIAVAVVIVLILYIPVLFKIRAMFVMLKFTSLYIT